MKAASEDGETLIDLLRHRAELTPEQIPLCIDGMHPLTYRAWFEGAQLLAENLAELPKTKGVVFGLLFDGMDWRNYAVAYAAVGLVGGVALHLNGRMPESEMIRRLESCGAGWIIRSSFLACPLGYEAACGTVQTGFHAATHKLHKSCRVYSRISEIRYTSGTTGPAKGYTVPHANLLFNQTLDSLTKLSESRSILAPITLADSSSATLLTMSITGVSRIVTCLPNDVERMGELIESLAIQSFMLTPAIIRSLINSRLDERYNLTTVTLLAFSSSPASAKSTRELRRIFPNAQIQVACAQSEASPALLAGIHDQMNPFVVGFPTANTEIRIVDSSGCEVPDREVGELWLRTPAEKRLFVGLPDRNRSIIEDGWYRTGDFVRRCIDGSIEYFDRRNDVLEKDGRLISSVHLEGLLVEHECVKEVAVVSSFRDEDAVFVAFVIPTKPVASRTLINSLNDLCQNESLIDRVIVVDDLPRTATGKLIKRDLRIIASSGLVKSD